MVRRAETNGAGFLAEKVELLSSSRFGGKWLQIFNNSATAGFLMLIYQT